MRARRQQQGFTLLEVVIAFVVLALILTSAFQVFSTGLSRAGMLEERSQALAIAQSRLAAAGQEEAFKEGETSGDTADRKYHWSVRTKVHTEDPAPGAGPAQANLSLYRVDATVTWRSGDGRDQAFTLSSLVLGAKSS